MKILIAAEHVLFRDGLQSLLSQEPLVEVVGLTNTAQGAVEQAANLKPDVVLMDIKLREGTGLEALRAIKAKQLPCNVVILSDQDTNENLSQAFQAGAAGYMLKDTPVESLLAALRAVGRGERILSRLLTSRLVEAYVRLGHDGNVEPVSFDSLTLRELEVLRHMSTGANNREIAERLVISEHTVKVHVRNILEKLKMKKRSQVVSMSLRNAVEPAVRRSINGPLIFAFGLGLSSLVWFKIFDPLWS